VYLIIQLVLIEQLPFVEDILGSGNIAENETEQKSCPHEA
jgi:hypothetical protein